MREIFTVGHSIHSWERFLALLKAAQITGVADVRSVPYSRNAPHFQQREFQGLLKSEGVVYSFLGRELGGRPANPSLMTDGIADYEKMASESNFAEGIGRLVSGMKRYRIALVCAEQEPLDCHRCLLVGRQLQRMQISVQHILPNGAIEAHDVTEERLLACTEMLEKDLFASSEQRLVHAYQARAQGCLYGTSGNVP